MYQRLAQDVEDAPVPPDIRSSDVLYPIYLDERNRRVMEIRDIARVGFDRCLAHAAREHWFNNWTQTCERGLNTIDPRRYPLTDEVAAPATRVFNRPAVARPVYELRDAAGEDVPAP
jgi:hypothetical protein